MPDTAATQIRRALEKLPATCRYHGDNTQPDRPGWGREACCDTGIPAQRRKLAEAALDQLVNELAAQPDTCGASMYALGGDPVGPCILRASHDGPVHQDATGAKWWPHTDPALILGS